MAQLHQAGHWQRAQRGLLQGCPFSPMLLATLMTLWTNAVKAQNNVNFAIYVDDRNMWMHGPDVLTTLPRVLEISRQVDALLGFYENVQKTQVATVDPDLRQQVNLITPEGFPEATASGKILGLHYDLQLQQLTISEDAIAKFQWRAQRIRQATRQAKLQQRLLHSLAISCLT